MVKGTITNETGNAPSPRKFVQTFLLAQQPTGYYVRNDILRYLAEESAKTSGTSLLKKKNRIINGQLSLHPIILHPFGTLHSAN
jgi:hypothetical protein